MPTVSCVITSYNNGEWLKEAILSVLSQSRPVEEIIVADDASTDGSQGLIESLALRHASVIPLLRQKNLGVSANRGLALDVASGDLITSLDGDDYFLPQKIEKEVGAIESRGCHVAFSDYRSIIKGHGAQRVERTAEFATLTVPQRLRWILRSKHSIPGELLVSRKVHQDIGGYAHKLEAWEDWDYSLRLAALPGCWAHSGVEGHVHRGHPGGLSDKGPSQHSLDRIRVIRSNNELIRGHLGTAFYADSFLREVFIGGRREVRLLMLRTRRRTKPFTRRSHRPNGRTPPEQGC
jgi:glycosyltransferase involved in cell wall biosynthesis